MNNNTNFMNDYLQYRSPRFQGHFGIIYYCIVRLTSLAHTLSDIK